VALAWDPAAGIIAGGVLGPLLGMVAPARGVDRPAEGLMVLGPEPDPSIGIPS
ncbi:MAG: hypothetical protein QOI92_2901, partial [Chloroflexota bacterium]|nr:hypothetical protein [Chloroflexota bacterium]